MTMWPANWDPRGQRSPPPPPPPGISRRFVCLSLAAPAHFTPICEFKPEPPCHSTESTGGLPARASSSRSEETSPARCLRPRRPAVTTHCEGGHEVPRTARGGPTAELRGCPQGNSLPRPVRPQGPELVTSALVPKSHVNKRSLQGA